MKKIRHCANNDQYDAPQKRINIVSELIGFAAMFAIVFPLVLLVLIGWSQ